MTHDQRPAGERSWPEKFRDAFNGLSEGVHDQGSFLVHFAATAVVAAIAAALRIDSVVEWCILLLCIAIVLAAEMFNSALEHMARAVTRKVDPDVGKALDIGSAAVLVAAIGATITGAAIFINRLGMLIGWW